MQEWSFANFILGHKKLTTKWHEIEHYQQQQKLKQFCWKKEMMGKNFHSPTSNAANLSLKVCQVIKLNSKLDHFPKHT
jgi:hypothetical protein